MLYYLNLQEANQPLISLKRESDFSQIGVANSGVTSVDFWVLPHCTPTVSAEGGDHGQVPFLPQAATWGFGTQKVLSNSGPTVSASFPGPCIKTTVCGEPPLTPVTSLIHFQAL